MVLAARVLSGTLRAALVRGMQQLEELPRRARGLALKVERSAKLNMRGSRSRAKRLGRRVTAPEGVLGIDTGHLRQSITSVVEEDGRVIRIIVGPQRVPYAAIHELGGVAREGQLSVARRRMVGRVRMPARPYLVPAAKEHEQEAIEIFGRPLRLVT